MPPRHSVKPTAHGKIGDGDIRFAERLDHASGYLNGTEKREVVQVFD